MSEGRPWLYSADVYALCATVHRMVFGSDMQVDVVDTEEGPRYRVQQPLDGLWAAGYWETLFDALLNLPTDFQPCEVLEELAGHFDSHLSSDASKSKQIRPLLMKQNILMSRG